MFAYGSVALRPRPNQWVADQVLHVGEGDAAARDVDDARRVRELLVVVVLPSALLERFSLVFDILLGER